jgi:hypothetical protein
MADHLCQSIEVHVEGSHPARMEAEALSAAANFFGTPAGLRVSLWQARPVAYAVMSGAPVGWEADITITLNRT